MTMANHPPSCPATTRRCTAATPRGMLGALALACLALAALGCQPRDIQTGYGSRSGYGGNSVNGTSVFSSMIQQAGHRVRSWPVLSPSLAKADVVVWFPTSSDAPSPDAVAWMEDWLSNSFDQDTWQRQARTLVVVGRQYDAEKLYWQNVQSRAPAGLAPEYKRRLQRARTAKLPPPTGKLPAEAGAWYSVRKPKPQEAVTQFAGPWAEGLDAGQATVTHGASIHPSGWLDTLLADGNGHPLVSHGGYGTDEPWQDYNTGGSRLLVIENGSFLLNAPLVNKENRKLAGKVVEYLGRPRKNVVFLESDAAPQVRDVDPNTGPPTGFQLFNIWPIGAILAQAAALGLVYALWRFPIFGVPRQLERPALTDFSRHVGAVGRLLAATRDRAYAKGLIQQYFSEKH